MKKYYLYILQSEKDDSFYVGITSDIKKRLLFHNNGWQRYTKNKRPWKLVYIREFSSKSEALKQERKIKKKKSKKYIKWLIDNAG